MDLTDDRGPIPVFASGPSGMVCQSLLIEEYHKCLKTGCRVEQRQLETADGLMNLFGFLAIVSVRLLQLRTLTPRTGYPGRASHSTAPVEDNQSQIRAILPSPKFGPILAGRRSLRRLYWAHVGGTTRLADFVEGLDTIARLVLGR